MTSQHPRIAARTRSATARVFALVLAAALPLGAVVLAGAPPAVALEPGAAAASGAPEWDHEIVADGTAVAWIEREVSTDAGASLRIRGAGWTDASGLGGSTVAIKLGAGPLSQYSRSGADVISHPSAGGEATIWALLAPENPTGHPGVHPIGEAGDFDIVIDLPEGLLAGQELTVRFQSGLFAAGDTQRTLTTAPLVVGGVPFAGGEEETLPTCVPSSPEPVVIVAESASIGGTLSVSGTGWCHPGEAGGGSRIAIKIDEGQYKHLTGDVHSNLTIWAIVDADHETGDWTTELQLPDGTGSTSVPAFVEGSHTLRLLTGSLKDGDASRTLRSAPFVVGEYSPGATPEPLDIEGGALTEANRNGVTVEQRATPAPGSWVVTVPGAAEGEWVFVNAYAGSSSRTPFPDWHRIGAGGELVLSLAHAALTPGELRVTVQTGERSRSGELIGWTTVVVAADPPPRVEIPALVTPAAQARGPVRLAPSAAAPLAIPAAPVKRSSQLNASNAGAVVGSVAGGVATLTVSDREAGEWVYAYVYTGSEARAIGWIQLDDERRIRIDVGELPEGNHKVALIGADGSLIGWASAATGVVTVAELSREDPDQVVEDSAQAGAIPTIPSEQGWISDLLLAGGAVLLLVAAGSAALVIRHRKGM